MNNKMKGKKYHIIGTVSNSKIKLTERDNIGNHTYAIPKIRIHGHSLSLHVTGT